MNDPASTPTAEHVASPSRDPDTIRRPAHAIVHVGIVDEVIPCARPVATAQAIDALTRPRTDRLAIASAVCGFTAIVPIVAQVAGLSLGMAGLIRIRRARRRGVLLAGSGWAWTGILTSGFALLGWVAMFGALMLVGASLSGTTESLQAAFQTLP